MGIKKENRGILSKSLSNGKGVDRRIMTELDANKKAEELLKGAYDLHVHRPLFFRENWMDSS